MQESFHVISISSRLNDSDSCTNGQSKYKNGDMRASEFCTFPHYIQV